MKIREVNENKKRFIELALPENLSGRAVFHPAASSIFSIKMP